MTDTSADVQRGAAGSFFVQLVILGLISRPRARGGRRREEYSFRRVVRGGKKKGRAGKREREGVQIHSRVQTLIYDVIPGEILQTNFAARYSIWPYLSYFFEYRISSLPSSPLTFSSNALIRRYVDLARVSMIRLDDGINATFSTFAY